MGERFDILGSGAARLAEVVIGYEFRATLQLRTPAAILRRHCEMHIGVDNPPIITTERWQGIWVPKMKTLRAIGIALDEPASMMISDVGQIPVTGGSYLPFLIELREAVEGSGAEHDWRAAARKMLRQVVHADIVHKLGGEDRILVRLENS